MLVAGDADVDIPAPGGGKAEVLDFGAPEQLRFDAALDDGIMPRGDRDDGIDVEEYISS